MIREGYLCVTEQFSAHLPQFYAHSTSVPSLDKLSLLHMFLRLLRILYPESPYNRDFDGP